MSTHEKRASLKKYKVLLYFIENADEILKAKEAIENRGNKSSAKALLRELNLPDSIYLQFSSVLKVFLKEGSVKSLESEYGGTVIKLLNNLTYLVKDANTMTASAIADKYGINRGHLSRLLKNDDRFKSVALALKKSKAKRDLKSKEMRESQKTVFVKKADRVLASLEDMKQDAKTLMKKDLVGKYARKHKVSAVYIYTLIRTNKDFEELKELYY